MLSGFLSILTLKYLALLSIWRGPPPVRREGAVVNMGVLLPCAKSRGGTPSPSVYQPYLDCRCSRWPRCTA